MSFAETMPSIFKVLTSLSQAQLGFSLRQAPFSVWLKMKVRDLTVGGRRMFETHPNMPTRSQAFRERRLYCSDTLCMLSLCLSRVG